MAKGIHRHGSCELPIDPMQQIDIECRDHALCVVIGRQENVRVLDAVDADQQHRARPERCRHHPE
jgi:hypothetical protein